MALGTRSNVIGCQSKVTYIIQSQCSKIFVPQCCLKVEAYFGKQFTIEFPVIIYYKLILRVNGRKEIQICSNGPKCSSLQKLIT